MDRIVEHLAETALADLVSNGGGTYEGRTLLPFNPPNGYAVGIGGFAMKAECVTAPVIAWALKAVAGEYETTYAGTWMDLGVVYFDAVRYMSNRNLAIHRAREAGQKAIYSFADKRVIDL